MKLVNYASVLAFLLVVNQAGGNTTTLKHCEPNVNSTSHYSAEHSLITCLFDPIYYSTFVRPAVKVTDKITVNFELRHVNIINLDTKLEMLKLQFWTYESWTDDRLTWNPADFQGLDQITVPKSLIWTPNIVMYNREESELTNPGDNLLVTIKADGVIISLTEQKAHAPCAMNMKHFPYDIQHCHLLFASWTYTEKQLQLNAITKFPTHIYQDYNWQVASLLIDPRRLTSIKRTDYSNIIYNMVMKRKTSYFTKTLILPAVLVTLVMCSLFFLRPQHRLNIDIGLFIVCTLILNQVDNFLSTNAGNIPMIVSYISFQMVMLSLQILMSLFVLNCLTSADKTNHVPQILKTILFGKVCKLLFIPSNHYARHPVSMTTNATEANWSPIISNGMDSLPADEINNSESKDKIRILKDIRQILSDQSKEKESNSIDSLKQMNESDWILLSKIVDRACFLVFFIITILVTISIIHS